MKDELDVKTGDLLAMSPVPVNMLEMPDIKNPVGRPRLFEDNAARQKAYRAKMKLDGKRVVARVVVDRRVGGITVKSDVILIPDSYRTRARG